MPHIQQRRKSNLAMITGALLALASCGQPDTMPENDETSPPKAAVLTVFVDVSSSTALIDGSDFANHVIDRVGKEIDSLELGDKIRVLTIGDRTSNRSYSQLEIETGIGMRLPLARTRVVEKLHEIIDRGRRSGGDESTNLVSTMEGSQPECTPRSRVLVLSDGMESSSIYSTTNAIKSGQSVNIPAAAHAYLRGCEVTMLGIGIAADKGTSVDNQSLDSHQVESLSQGWSRYFQSAGVSAADIRFTPIQ